jgi:hypothetical protein
MSQMQKWRVPRQEFLSNLKPGEKLPDGVQNWPIEKTFVPISDIWKATGTGTVAIIRRSPSGNCWSCIAPIQLNMGGIMSFSGATDKPLQEILDLFNKMSGEVLLPPSEEGSPELAARYLWGTYAWGIEHGGSWPPGTRKRFLNLFPPLAGVKDDWLRQFTKSDPLVPANLLDAMRRFPTPPDLPEGKEIVINTLMIMDLPNPAEAIAALRSKPALFLELASDGEQCVFHWMKERRAAPGKKVPHGAIRITANEMTLEGPTFSASAELALKVRQTVGPEPRLKKAKWADVTKLTFSPPGMTSTPRR